ncbi:MAG TPA: methyltransferase domain-containing protein, partial [Balneolales bacterium]|nr:methyltransferase domain-containing protein [Balneolales bacterium]
MELNDLMELIQDGEKIVIELGCGEKKQPGTIGIDKLPLKNVDYVWDLEKGLSFLPDNSVDEIRSKHFLEHVEHFEELTKEIHRVLKPGGIQIVTVPHFSNPYYYSDFTHRRFFGLYSYDYFSDPEFQLRRKVPAFYVD